MQILEHDQDRAIGARRVEQSLHGTEQDIALGLAGRCQPRRPVGGPQGEAGDEPAERVPVARDVILEHLRRGVFDEMLTHLHERLVGQLEPFIASTRQNQRAGSVRLVRDLAHQTGLPDAGITSDERRSPAGRGHLRERLSERVTLRLPVDEDRRAVGLESAGQRDPCLQRSRHPRRGPRARGEPGGTAAGDGQQRRRLLEDLGLQRLQGRSGLEPQMLGELHTGAMKDLERLLLAAAAVQGQHQLTRHPLPGRMLGEQALQLADEHAVPAQTQICVDPALQREQP